MIDQQKFIQFLRQNFENGDIFLNEFKPTLWFIQVDCFKERPYKLALEISDEDIKFATASKEPVLDFSLYNYSVDNNSAAEKKILQFKEDGFFS